ncbi:MAG: glycoside hydrolase [Clostridia bacterium]|nr:glycoside hydrolase [Clostridia bacterium]
MKLFENNGHTYSVTPDGGELFFDHSINQRSGHLGHAMVEYKPGKILDFFPNCSGQGWNGHNGNGWMEFRRSEDAGKTWSEPEPFPYSKTLYDLNLGITSMCEKTVITNSGKVIIFNVICDLIDNNGCGWEPFGIPTYVSTLDGGKSWSSAKRVGTRRGRIYDACYKDGTIYVLMVQGASANKGFHCEYHLFCSVDDGETFEERSALPFISHFDANCFYGALVWLKDGRLAAYAYYDQDDEFNIPYTISCDNGKTWEMPKKTYFAKRIRNMQIASLNGTYFCAGRSGSHGTKEEQQHNIVYCSKDGINWDEGYYLKMSSGGVGAYSNFLLVKGAEKPYLLYQASWAYEGSKTNIYHWYFTED